MTAVDLVPDFLAIHKAKHRLQEFDEEVRLWLELLELVVSISYRKAESSALFSTPDYAITRLQRTADSKQIERRSHWVSVRKDISSVTDKEHTIYSAWSEISIRSPSGSSSNLPKPARKLSSIIPFFFTISARIASFIDQGISEKWADLAAQFMLHTALESCLTHQGERSSGDSLALAFAWGWIPSTYWDEFYDLTDDSGTKTELIIS